MPMAMSHAVPHHPGLYQPAGLPQQVPGHCQPAGLPQQVPIALAQHLLGADLNKLLVLYLIKLPVDYINKLLVFYLITVMLDFVIKLLLLYLLKLLVDHCILELLLKDFTLDLVQHNHKTLELVRNLHVEVLNDNRRL